MMDDFSITGKRTENAPGELKPFKKYFGGTGISKEGVGFFLNGSDVKSRHS